MNFAQRGRRDAALLEEKSNYQGVAAILDRVRYVFTTENTEFTEKCLKKNTNSPLCSPKRLGTLCGEKLFLAVSAFRSSDFISRQVKNYGVNKRGVNPLLPV